ncbi:MAG: Nramp family divalent metal transporter [Brevinematales bacterium]|jgi:manganese transport protein
MAVRKKMDKAVISEADEILSGKGRRRGIFKFLPFLGPAFIASIAYMDPGNFATNIQGGSEFGYRLIWVIIASNLTAMLIQVLSAKLGIATGMNLAELCRSRMKFPVVFSMWIIMEIVAMATDLAEFVGAAIGFNLLFGMPLWEAGLLTAFVTFLILALETYGFRPLEAVITSLVGVIALSYLVETLLSPPDWGQVGINTIIPSFSGKESVFIAVGILGATVMPHVIFLHSSLTQGRIVTRDPAKLKRLFHFELIDVGAAMGLAGLINAAMLIMAATTFYKHGMNTIATIQDAYKTLIPLLGPAAAVIFAVSLLASGLSSSSVGTMAGQIIMQGFIRRKIPVWVRRLITVIPSMVVLISGLDPTRTLVYSQVVLSFGLPFAVLPLVWFTSSKEIMGGLVNRIYTIIPSAAAAVLILFLNFYLIWQFIFGG